MVRAAIKSAKVRVRGGSDLEEGVWRWWRLVLRDVLHVDATQRQLHPVHCGTARQRGQAIVTSFMMWLTWREDPAVPVVAAAAGSSIEQFKHVCETGRHAGNGEGDAQFLRSCSGEVGASHWEMSTPSKVACFAFDLHSEAPALSPPTSSPPSWPDSRPCANASLACPSPPALPSSDPPPVFLRLDLWTPSSLRSSAALWLPELSPSLGRHTVDMVGRKWSPRKSPRQHRAVTGSQPGPPHALMSKNRSPAHPLQRGGPCPCLTAQARFCIVLLRDGP